MAKVSLGFEKGAVQAKFLFSPLHCPTQSCGEVLFEMEQGFWTDKSEMVKCPKCGLATGPQLCSLSEDKPGNLNIRFWCSACREEFDREVPAIRKYCHSCKAYHIIFFWKFLRLQHYLSSREESNIISRSI